MQFVLHSRNLAFETVDSVRRFLNVRFNLLVFAIVHTCFLFQLVDFRTRFRKLLLGLFQQSRATRQFRLGRVFLRNDLVTRLLQTLLCHFLLVHGMLLPLFDVFQLSLDLLQGSDGVSELRFQFAFEHRLFLDLLEQRVDFRSLTLVFFLRITERFFGLRQVRLVLFRLLPEVLQFLHQRETK